MAIYQITQGHNLCQLITVPLRFSGNEVNDVVIHDLIANHDQSLLHSMGEHNKLVQPILTLYDSALVECSLKGQSSVPKVELAAACYHLLSKVLSILMKNINSAPAPDPPSQWLPHQRSLSFPAPPHIQHMAINCLNTILKKTPMFCCEIDQSRCGVIEDLLYVSYMVGEIENQLNFDVATSSTSLHLFHAFITQWLFQQHCGGGRTNSTTSKDSLLSIETISMILLPFTTWFVYPDMLLPMVYEEFGTGDIAGLLFDMQFDMVSGFVFLSCFNSSSFLDLPSNTYLDFGEIVFEIT
jgi:hypothetical protein